MTKRGMLPGEYMVHSLVEVWPRDAIESDDPPYRGTEEVVDVPWEETRPELYVPILRRNGLKWQLEVMKAVPIEDGVVPHKVFERLWEMRRRIMLAQKSDRGKDQAAIRKVINVAQSGELVESEGYDDKNLYDEKEANAA